MIHQPGIYLAALFLWLIPVLSARSEFQFLTTTPNLPRSQGILSAIILLLFVALDAALLCHTLFPNVVWFFTAVVFLGIGLMIGSTILLSSRMRIIRDLSRQRHDERRDLVREAKDLIVDARRAKIRAKYGEDG